MESIFLITFAISFAITLFLMPFWIKRATKAGLTGRDIHKLQSKQVAEIGGLPVLAGFIIGLLSYVAIKTFLYHQTLINDIIMASVSTLLFIGIIGLIDDILGWKIGLKQWQKPILVIIASLPLMVINAGTSNINLPFFGVVNLGIIYPLVFIPLMITVFANGFNMLAGYNGLEAGQGILILGTLGLVVWLKEDLGPIAMIAGCAMFALIAFLLFNWYPSRIFPGDTLTYVIGATIAVVAILGNAQKVAVFLFVLYILEFFLKLRGRFKIESFSKLDSNGNLLPAKNIYGIEHIAVRFLNRIGKATELRTVILIQTVQAIICALILMIYLR